jgi:hypothetical protein
MMKRFAALPRTLEHEALRAHSVIALRALATPGDGYRGLVSVFVGHGAGVDVRRIERRGSMKPLKGLFSSACGLKRASRKDEDHS